MFRVFGRVLLRENGAPIANVIVAAFDTDQPNREQPVELARADRLGSAPTDSRGEFSIEFTEREYADDGEPRADVVVAVFAPEIAGRDAPVHPLYVSGVVRRRSGAIEGYVIYLPSALLIEFGVPIPALSQSDAAETLATANELTHRISRRNAQQAAVRAVLAPEISRSRQQRREADALLARFFRPLRTLGAVADRYVPPGASAAAVLAQARADGVARLASMSARLPGISLRGRPKLLQTLGFTQTESGWVPPTDGVSGETFDHAAPHLFVPPAVRLISLLEKCKATEQAKAAEPHPPHTPSTPPPSTDVVPFEEAILQEAQDAVLSLDVQNGTGDRPSPGTVAAALATKIDSSPADAPSYHDFHSLRIAWFDVWASVIDGVAYSALQELYQSIVRVVPEAVVAEDFSEIDDLKALLKQLDDVVWALAAATAPDSASVAEELKKTTLEEFDEAKWDWIVYGMQPGEEMASKASLEKARVFLEEKLTAILVQLAPESDSIAPPASLGLSSRLERTLKSIKKRLAEGYKFDVFQPESYNYGIVTTYRQRWQPIAYQAGDLVATIPLAPGEKRTYTTKQTIKTTRAQKEVERNLSARHGESVETGRSEAEIIRKANYSTNFKMTAEGGFHVAVAHAGGSVEFGANQTLDSAETKRFFREAVRKATQEYRNERTIELSTENVAATEAIDTGEISNPNNELTVTYLFYELQRRVEVSEQLHRVTPVVLFAFEVPSPDQVDEGWLLANDWILRRVLLDDQLLPALDMLADSFAGDELAVDIRRREWETQLQVVKALQRNESLHLSLRVRARDELRKALRMTGGGGSGGLMGTVTSTLFGNDDDSGVEARRNAAQQALNWVEADFARAEEELTSAVSALQASTEAYTTAVRDQLNRRTAIDRLRVHVKENILYYMQAIWLHEPPDQRYFRVYDKPIDWPATAGVSWVVEHPPTPPTAPPTDSGGFTPSVDSLSGSIDVPPLDLGEAAKAISTVFDDPSADYPLLIFKLIKPVLDGGTRLLHEVADIDNLIGFKGNYAIFPLKEHNAITLYMSQAFLDTEFGVKDPDPWGEIPPASDAVEIARCAWHHPGTNEDDRKAITKWLLRMLANQRKVSEEVIIPTGQLFIEALTGSHTLLEDFKLRHRALDVEKARAEMVQAKLEALRYAARISEGKLDDPEIQTQILGAGAGVNVNVPGGPTPNP